MDQLTGKFPVSSSGGIYMNKKIKGVKEQRRGEAKYCKKQIQKQEFRPENKTNVKRNKGT